MRVGVLLLVLPLAATAVLAGTRLRLSCARTLEPRRVSAGSLVQVTLRLENRSRRTTPALFAEDLVLPDQDSPLSTGTEWNVSPHFALDRLGGGAVRTLTYTLRPPRRGRYELGPLTVRLCDPFGFCELPRMFQTVDTLLVTPEVVTLPRVDPTGRWTAGSVAAGGRIGGTGEDDAGTRPYRLGDEFRRVHWRTTARTGELSVRREEQPRQGAVTLLLDTRASAWPPGTARGLDAGPAGGSFETAVSTVASMAVALASAGTAVHVVTLDGEELGRIPGGRWSTSVEVGAVLDQLASVGVGPVASGPGSVDAGASPPSDGSRGSAARRRPVSPLRTTDDRVIAVLGVRRVEVASLPTSTAGPGLALVVGADADVSALTAAGWVAATLPTLSALPLLWQRFGTTATSAGRGTLR